MGRLWQHQCAILIYIIFWRTCPKKASRQCWVMRQLGLSRALDQESLSISQVSFEIISWFTIGVSSPILFLHAIIKLTFCGTAFVFQETKSYPSLSVSVESVTSARTLRQISVWMRGELLYSWLRYLKILVEHISRPALIYAAGQGRLVTMWWRRQHPGSPVRGRSSCSSQEPAPSLSTLWSTRQPWPRSTLQHLWTRSVSSAVGWAQATEQQSTLPRWVNHAKIFHLRAFENKVFC